MAQLNKCKALSSNLSTSKKMEKGNEDILVPDGTEATHL
jgi:hypothetical protein